MSAALTPWSLMIEHITNQREPEQPVLVHVNFTDCWRGILLISERFPDLVEGKYFLPQNIAWCSVASEHFSHKVFCVALSDVELDAPAQVNFPWNYSNEI